jgi:3-hydroxyisobutyrate dehydrogenase
MATPTVALLGTGIMGTGIAHSLLRARLPLRVWNRTRAKAEPLAEEGAAVADTPAEAVRAADIIVTMLFDGAAVEQAMFGEGGAADAFKDGAVWIQMSTVGSAAADHFAQLAAERGLVYVDAPVLGTREPAEQGTLVILASGPDHALETCGPVFAAIGKKVLWVGPAGAGSRLKLSANSWVVALADAVAEAIALAEGLGIDPRLFLDAINDTATDSPYAHLKGRLILDRQLTPSFPARGAEKDCRLILEAADGAGVEMGLTAAAQRHYARAIELGHGDEDLAAVYYAHQRLPT